LYEELLVEEEGILKTENEKIFVTHPKDVGMDCVHRMVSRLICCIQSDENVKEVLKRYIETFRDEAPPPRQPAAVADNIKEVCE
jgi:FlaA1/EpsC-like NDP-sugar epimerase